MVEVFERALEQELENSKSINTLYELATTCNDYATKSHLQWFLDEQVEEEKSIEDIMASMKGIPGMEGIKMFSADDLKGKNFEQMGDMFGGGKPRSTTRAEHRQRLVDFYTQYGMTDKLDGVDAALDKWKGREERMFDKLYQKYDSEIKAKWDKDAEPEKEEL